MKMIVISSDGPALAYRVPDEVADALDEWCGDFCRWLWEGRSGNAISKTARRIMSPRTLSST